MRLHYRMLSIAAACIFVFSGCTSENGEKSVVGDTDVEMRASNVSYTHLTLPTICSV